MVSWLIRAMDRAAVTACLCQTSPAGAGQANDPRGGQSLPITEGKRTVAAPGTAVRLKDDARAPVAGLHNYPVI